MGVDLSSAAPASASPSAPRTGAPTRGRWPTPGAVLAWASVGPALLVAAWLAAAYPLALAGRATPLLALPAFAAVAAALLGLARRLPAVPAAPWWPVLATLAVGVAFAVHAALHASGHVVLRRDSAVYALFAHWIAETGALSLSASLQAIGGPDPALFTTATPGFYLVGTHGLSAQFMSGTALTLAPAGWGGGFAGIQAVPALVGAAGLVAVGGLAGRLLGARWAPAAALLLGLAQPVTLTARGTYSEPIAQLLLAGALCLLLDGVAGPHRRLAGLAGLLAGIGLLVRIDALRELALLIPVVAWLALRRHPAWPWLLGGTLVGTGYGVVDALGPSRAYVRDMWPSARPAVYAAAALAAAALVAVPAGRLLLPRLRSRPWYGTARLAVAVAGTLGMAALVAVLAARPYGAVAHGAGNAKTIVRSLQLAQGLPVDPDRTYAEQSVRWVSWFLGWPALVLAAGAAVALTWQALRRTPAGRRWALALAVPLTSAVAVLWKPGITPDHPWADRRLVPTVLPVVVLLSLWAVAALGRLLRPYGDRAAAGVVAVGLVALLLPAEAGSRALRWSSTEKGEPAAVAAACAAFRPGEVAVLIDARSRQEWTAPLRIVCGIPTFGVPGKQTDKTATPAEVEPVLAKVRAAGQRPVLVAQSGEPLPKLTAAPQVQVVDLDTTEHERLLTTSPTTVAGLSVELWLARP